MKVVNALSGVDIVIHTASFGMSGKEMLMKSMIHEVNVNGTQNIIDGCIMQGVKGLVYTSSANVVFSGRVPMPDPAEDLPYNKEEDCVDEYSKTKCIAEKRVIAANGTKLHSKSNSTSTLSSNNTDNIETLATCAVRPAAIYGDGEERHFPRLISMLENGLLQFNVGDPDDRVDWVYIDNLVYGHVLAVAKLLHPEGRSIVGGKAYYISDKKPMNNWVFMKPLIEGLGYKFPTIWIPFRVVYMCGHFIEILHRIVNPIIPFNPLLSRAEVCKVAVTHYFRTDKAERELDWSLLVTPEEGISRMTKYFVKKNELRKHETRNSKKLGNSGFLVWAFLFLIALFIYHMIFGKSYPTKLNDY